MGLTAPATDLTDRATGAVRMSMVRTLAPFLARYPKVSLPAVLDATELAPRQIADPAAWITVRKCVALLDGLAAAANDGAFSLAFAHQMPWADLGMLQHVVFNSPTLGAALGNACKYFGLQSTGAGARLEVAGREARIVYGIHDPAVQAHAQNTQLVFTLLVRMAREGLGDPTWRPRAVEVRHDRPRNAGTQAGFFGAPVAYGADEDVLVLAPEDFLIPIPRADPTLFALVTERADATLRSASDDLFHAELRRIIRTALRSGDATVEHVAARLDTSTRTLQRRLGHRGRSFSDVVDEVRLAAARHYLRASDLALTDIALALGYSELSAFSRAFRRWTGTSALAYRRSEPF